MTNFNQILDEIQQQKLAVASSIDETQAKIAQYETDIVDCNAELVELQAQLAGLATLEQKTQELQQTANDTNINLNINVNGQAVGGSTAVNHGYAA